MASTYKQVTVSSHDFATYDTHLGPTCQTEFGGKSTRPSDQVHNHNPESEEPKRPKQSTMLTPSCRCNNEDTESVPDDELDMLVTDFEPPANEGSHNPAVSDFRPKIGLDSDHSQTRPQNFQPAESAVKYQTTAYSSQIKSQFASIIQQKKAGNISYSRDSLSPQKSNIHRFSFSKTDKNPEDIVPTSPDKREKTQMKKQQQRPSGSNTKSGNYFIQDLFKKQMETKRSPQGKQDSKKSSRAASPTKEANRHSPTKSLSGSSSLKSFSQYNSSKYGNVHNQQSSGLMTMGHSYACLANDPLLGSLHSFVQTEILTVQAKLAQKQQILAELKKQRDNFEKTKREIFHAEKSQQLLVQELTMVSNKNQMLRDCIDDMEDKKKQKQFEYQDEQKQQDYHLHQAKERYRSIEQRETQGKKNEVQTAQQRIDQVLWLKQREKEADKQLFEYRAQRDHEGVLEKNRMKLLREKKNELSKWIDFEKDGRSLLPKQPMTSKSAISTPRNKQDTFQKIQKGVLGKKKENHSPYELVSKSPRVEMMDTSKTEQVLPMKVQKSINQTQTPRGVPTFKISLPKSKQGHGHGVVNLY